MGDRARSVAAAPTRAPSTALRALRAVAILAAVGAPFALACRDDVDPFDPDEFPGDPDAPVVRLTASLSDDRAPSWSLAGDSVFYATEGFDHLPPAPGVLVGLPRFGGVAQPILPSVQNQTTGTRLWLAAPVAQPGTDRLAFTEVTTLRAANPCPGATLSCQPPTDSIPLPGLREFTLWVREFDAVGPLTDSPGLVVRVPGVVLTLGATLDFDVDFRHTLQAFDEDRALLFRPSWDPAGERLAFSDGLRLFIWRPGDDEAVPIPGTMDAAGAAWSPTGDWIAFSRFEVADSANFQCAYIAALGACAILDYTIWTPGPRTLTLVRPDGSEIMELGPGDEPAWSPDGTTLYFRRGDRIWRVGLAGGIPEPVPNTEAGREPAISPDGRHLAFARRVEPGNHDIWVIALDP